RDVLDAGDRVSGAGEAESREREKREAETAGDARGVEHVFPAAMPSGSQTVMRSPCQHREPRKSEVLRGLRCALVRGHRQSLPTLGQALPRPEVLAPAHWRATL